MLDRLAFTCLCLLAVSLGVGDIAQVTPFDTAVLNGVHGLLLLVIGLTLVAHIARGQRPAFPSSLALPMAAWLCVLLASAALAAGHRADALASLERPAGGALLAWAVVALCRTETRWVRLSSAIALGGLAIALVGLAEASGAPALSGWLALLRDGPIPIGDVPRIASTLSHPNEAAMLLELTLPLLVAWAWSASQPWRGLMPAAAFGTLLAIVLTFSRTGMAAALASLGVMAVSTSRHRDGRQLLPLAATALVVPLALTWAAVADPGLDRRLTAGVDESSSVQPSRPEFWSVALDMLRDHPLLGVGPDNFRSEFAAYSGVDADNLGIHAHDQYLEALADTGVLGFVTLAWLLTRLVRTSAAGVQRALGQSDWPWRAALLGSLTAWLLHALLDDFERFWPTSVAFWLIAGLTLCAPHTLGARRLEDSAVEQPEDQTNEGDHDQQNQDAGRTRQRGATSAAATEAHHRRALYGSSWPTPRT